MSLLDYFRSRKKTSASVAKERLQIIVAHERSGRGGPPEFLPTLQREILEVVSKYIAIEQDQIKVNFERTDGCDVLELNVVLPVNKR